MEMNYITIQRKVEQLCKHMDNNLFVSLLLICQLSQNNDFSMPFFTTNDDTQVRQSLWDMVLTKQEGNYVASIVKALMSVEASFPFVHDLIEKIEKQNVEEKLLEPLIDLLSNVSNMNMSCALIYENYLQGKLTKCSSSSGDFYTPKGIAQCLVALLNIDYGKVYDPCCGSGILLLATEMYSDQNVKLYGQALDEQFYHLCQMNFIFHEKHINLGKTFANTLLNDQHKNEMFDYIIANPPFNSANWFEDNSIFSDDRWMFGIPPRSNANFAWIQHILSHLSLNGRAVVLLPNGTLTAQTSREADIRHAMIQNHLIEAIITLPPGLFYSTTVPCCIWVLTNADRESGEILFIDATHMVPAIKKEIMPIHIDQLRNLVNDHRKGNLHVCKEWYGIASLETIKQNEFLLSPNLYLNVSRPKPFEIRKGYEKLIKIINQLSLLPINGDILSLITSWKNVEVANSWNKMFLLEIYDVFGGVTKSKDFFNKGFPLLDVKTVIHSPYMSNHFSASVEVTEEEKIKYGIRSGDVLLNRTSETIKELACCCIALKDYAAVYSGFIKRLRPKAEHVVNPFYASCYFRSEIYRWEVEKVSTVYTTYSSIDNKKLSKIAFYFPDEKMQKKIGNTLFEIFQFQERCSDELQKRLFKEFEQLLIQQYITYPILCIQNKEGDFQCI